MKSLHFATLMALALALGGCATDGPATNGDAARVIFASQIVPPASRAAQPPGIDGAAAVESYKNYVQSYDEPRPQLNDSAFRR